MHHVVTAGLEPKIAAQGLGRRSARTPSATEMYGFVSWVLSALCFVMYLLWAYVPDPYLDAVGISYRPAKYWAIAIPAWLCMTLLFYVLAAVLLSMLNTSNLDDISAITDLHARREVLPSEQLMNPSEMIPAIGDIPLSRVNAILYGVTDLKQKQM